MVRTFDAVPQMAPTTDALTEQGNTFSAVTGTLLDLAEDLGNMTLLTNLSEPCYLGYNCTTTEASPKPLGTEADDAIWILTSTFIIFTMQSGFGLLESGSVSTKNEVNIMVKNAADVIFGGLTYWIFGYGFSFGNQEPHTNGFAGWGNFFAITDEAEMGHTYSKFFFQASFATTATTIVSGAMAERTKLESYILFSFVNTLVYCFPAHWEWADNGWLKKMGMVDIAGAGAVHLVGGVTGLVATMMLKPRHGRYESAHHPPMGSPTNAILGTFMLWWGWLGFNCGSTFGISGPKWMLAARSAISTLASSMAGGTIGFTLRSAITTLVGSLAGGILGMSVSYIFKKRTFQIDYLINGLLGALVGITAFCALAEPWESFLIGLIGSATALAGVEFINYLKIDDPVGCVGVHAVGAVWSLTAPGLFAKKDQLAIALHIDADTQGLFSGGGFRLLGVQWLGIVSIASWAAASAFVLLKIIDLTIGLRIPLEEELLGADIVEHGVGDVAYDKATKRLIPLDTSPGFYLDSENHVKIEDENDDNHHHESPMQIQNGRRKSLIYENGTTHAFGAKLSRTRSLIKRSQEPSTSLTDTGPCTGSAWGTNNTGTGPGITNSSYSAEPESPQRANGREFTNNNNTQHPRTPEMGAKTRRRIFGSKKKRSTGNVFTNLFRRRRRSPSCSPSQSPTPDHKITVIRERKEAMDSTDLGLSSGSSEVCNAPGSTSTSGHVLRHSDTNGAVSAPPVVGARNNRSNSNATLEFVDEDAVLELRSSRL